MKKLCVGVAVVSGVLGLGWLGGIDYLRQHNVATMLWVGTAVWAGYMAAASGD